MGSIVVFEPKRKRKRLVDEYKEYMGDKYKTSRMISFLEEKSDLYMRLEFISTNEMTEIIELYQLIMSKRAPAYRKARELNFNGEDCFLFEIAQQYMQECKKELLDKELGKIPTGHKALLLDITSVMAKLSGDIQIVYDIPGYEKIRYRINNEVRPKEEIERELYQANILLVSKSGSVAGIIDGKDMFGFSVNEEGIIDIGKDEIEELLEDTGKDVISTAKLFELKENVN